MRAAVTRGGELVVGEVADPVPSSGHVVVRSLAAGICGSDLHALADFAHFTGLMDSVGVPGMLQSLIADAPESSPPPARGRGRGP